MTNKLRIATLGIHHETNTFASNKTTMAEFERSGLQTYAVQRGQQYYDMHEKSQTSMSGFIQASKKHEFELVPLLFAATDPAGTISAPETPRNAEMYRRSSNPLDHPMNATAAPARALPAMMAFMCPNLSDRCPNGDWSNVVMKVLTESRIPTWNADKPRDLTA